ncbi:MAG TPA: TRAFs-binding domain-containing protein [Rubrivivax sp.]|nr:TRAFs-binding domain-containing protein [Rubrivivax sp.]
MADTDIDALRRAARAALQQLQGRASAAELQAAKPLVEQLRNQRDYELMAQLAEAVSRRDPKDASNRRLYAQALIDTGKASAAVDLLQPLMRRLAQSDPEWAEAAGLLGRAWKQIYFDASDKSEAFARDALKKAIAAYRGPFEASGNPWHGVNLVALLERMRSSGWRAPAGLEGTAVAQQVVATLEATPPAQRDAWFLATLAEASLGLRDWSSIEGHVRQYVSAADTQAFHVAGTLRQFTQIWNLEAEPRGRTLVDLLRARLMQLQGAELRVAPAELQRLSRQDAPPPFQLEAVLGPNGAQTYKWWKTGIERAAAVACVRQRLGGRVGTGFLLRAGDLGREPADERLLLTNFHVINPQGASPGLAPADAEVVFEAVDANQAYDIAQIVWHSTPDRHDAALLRLATPVQGIAPLPIAAALPVLEDSARVYIIGHPGGRDLAFSFQDNELLDHEGPPQGQPAISGVTRLHYRAPTEGGSSGSPVFNSRLWQVVALHHAGGKIGMPRLNGKPGSCGANEGISMASIIAAMKDA